MKKNYTLLLIAILFCSSLHAQEQQKSLINYQGVARDAANDLMANEAMNLGLSIRFGSSSATVAYEENHSLTTDANGVFSLKIGNGTMVSGDYENLPWGSGAAFVTVSINGSEVGTTELMAVPYAISSGDGDNQSAAEVAYDNSVSNLSATNAQEAIDELVGSGTLDADADPTNEFQNLSFDTNTNELSLSDGNSVTIPSGGTDADADPTNELQTISFDVNTNELSLTDGGVVTIPSGGTDADADPTNEFQNLSFDTNTNELSLSNGNSVTIPSGGTDADADPTNELQDISLSGTNLSISDGSTIDLAPIVPPGGTDDQNLELTGDVLSIENGNGSVDLSSYRDDNDADPANEIQTLSFDSNTSELSLSDSNTVTLPNGGGGGTDDQNLEINGDVLSIENGNGSVDLSTYRDDADADPTNEIDVTTKNGLLTGNGAAVSGLVGTADGQVPKWNDTNNEWVIGTDETGGGSSRWRQNFAGALTGAIYYDEGNVGIGTSNAPDGNLEVYGNSNSNFPQLALTETEDEYARLAFQNTVHNGAAWNVAGTARNGGTGGANSNLNFFFKNNQGAEDIMTIKGDGRVGIRNDDPQATLDVNGSMNISGDFANQSVHKISVWNAPGPAGRWTPPASANENEVAIPQVSLNIDVPQGSKVFLSFNAEALIDSDYVSFRIKRGGVEIAHARQGFYNIANSRQVWQVSLDGLDNEVLPGNHTYTVTLFHSDDAEDGWWREIIFYAIVIKE